MGISSLWQKSPLAEETIGPLSPGDVPILPACNYARYVVARLHSVDVGDYDSYAIV